MSWLVIIIIVILLFGGGGGYYAHRSHGPWGLGYVILGAFMLIIIVWLLNGMMYGAGP